MLLIIVEGVKLGTSRIFVEFSLSSNISEISPEPTKIISSLSVVAYIKLISVSETIPNSGIFI